MAITSGQIIKASDISNIGSAIRKEGELVASTFKLQYNAKQRFFCSEIITLPSNFNIKGCIIMADTLHCVNLKRMYQCELIVSNEITFSGDCYMEMCSICGNKITFADNTNNIFWHSSILADTIESNGYDEYIDSNIRCQNFRKGKNKVRFSLSHVSVIQFYQDVTDPNHIPDLSYGNFITFGDYMYKASVGKISWDENNFVLVDCFMPE